MVEHILEFFMLLYVDFFYVVQDLSCEKRNVVLSDGIRFEERSPDCSDD